MAQKLYEETNIQEIANALRRKLGNTKTGMVTVQVPVADAVYKSDNVTAPAEFNGQTWGDTATTYNISNTEGKKMKIKYWVSPYVSATIATSITNKLLTLDSDSQNAQEGEITTSEKEPFIVTATSKTTNTDVGFYFEIIKYNTDNTPVSGYTDKEVEGEVPNTFKTSEMAAAVDSISGGSTVEATLVTKTITANGTYNASTSDNADGYSSVTVSVPDYVPNLQSKEVTITANGTQNIAADNGYDGLSAASVTVDVAPNLQSKTISVTENGAQTVSADASYDGLSNVVLTVNVPTSGGGSSLLDNFNVAFTSQNSLFGKSTFNVDTKRFGGGSGYYVWYVSDASVGDNVLEHLTSKNASNTNYAYMGFLGLTQSTSTPTLEEMKKSTYSNSDNILIYKYTSVSYTNSIDRGNLVICNGNGIVLFNGTWTAGIAALNNKTIDLSNGIFFLSTTCKTSSTGKYNTITFN